MKKLVLIVALLCLADASRPCATPGAEAPGRRVQSAEAAAWRQRAARITIVRDDWGIAHVYGPTDADAVFGVMYAQAEDDFHRIETNYLNAMGRLAEAEGEREIYRDLRMKLFIDPAEMRAQFDASPAWLKSLMQAFADGLNFYLLTHPAVKPRVITRFEPWMALTFSEGSIGGDIERINLTELERFYGEGPKTRARAEATPNPERPTGEALGEPTGSNGFAIAPSRSASGKALLWINPHTSFFFRAEAQMVSDEGLNAYGALTWGQFFVYQGFNDRAGWMHTSSSVDNIDEYVETIVRKGDALAYRYGAAERPVTTRTVTVPYRTAAGLAEKRFTIYATHHGPIVREADGKRISVRLMQEPLKALTQSYSRTKAKSYAAFKATMDLHTNSSNNTVFADADGNIAYFHANFIPTRDPKFDWTKPVDGTDPATEWGPVLSVDASPHVVNPRGGWIQNTNNAPWSAAGADSPQQRTYPSYVDAGTENPRGVHAMRVLDGKTGFTMDSLTAAAFDSYLTEFAVLIPALLDAYDREPADSARKTTLAEPIAELRAWDYRWSTSSIATTLAVSWGDELWQRVAADARKANVTVYTYMETIASPQLRLDVLSTVIGTLTADFGSWRTPWGDVNRFQRLTGDIVQPFDDKGPSLPVAFTSSRWGSLASFGARTFNGTKMLYGTSGNSFVAVVEFGDRVRARAVTAGGQSGDPRSKHFNDQAARYTTGALREVYFHRSQLDGHIERQYHPGQ